MWIVCHLYTHCTESTLIQPACALVRLFQTLSLHQLNKTRQRFARCILKGALPHEAVK